MARYHRRRPRRRPRTKATGPATSFAALVTAGTLLSAVVYLARHPWVLAAVAGAAVIVGACGVWLVQRRHEAERRRIAVLTASVAMCDGLTGPQFEHWVAALMRRTGFSQVQVRGGAGDLGADIVAFGDGRRRVVVQCKCLRADRAVGSPDIQRFAGTARTLHGADIAVVVTTGRFSRPAVEAAARLGIALVDRRALAAWAADGVSPSALGAGR